MAEVSEQLLPRRKSRLSETWIIILCIIALFLFCIGIIVSFSGSTGSLYNNAFYRELSPHPTFTMLCVGSGGGPFQNDLSGYLIGVNNRTDILPLKFGSFDGGTLLSGLQQMINNEVFAGLYVPPDLQLTKLGYILTLVTDFFISHSHLDHLVGAIIDSTVMGGPDYQKGLVGLNTTLNSIQNYIFNPQIWANFGDTGNAPLNQFRLTTLISGVPRFFSELQMEITPFSLVHGSVISTAFLIHATEPDKYLMYWGDVGPDSVQNVTVNRDIWQEISPLVLNDQMKGIIIECSYTNDRSDNELYGHLTPKYLMQELHVLSDFVKSPEKMAALVVMVAHIKPTLKLDEDVRSQIYAELHELNDLDVNLVFPHPGYRYDI